MFFIWFLIYNLKNQSVIYCLNTNKSCRKESVYYCVQVEVLLVDNWLLRNYRSSSPAATFVRRAFSWRACVGLGLLNCSMKTNSAHFRSHDAVCYSLKNRISLINMLGFLFLINCILGLTRIFTHFVHILYLFPMIGWQENIWWKLGVWRRSKMAAEVIKCLLITDWHQHQRQESSPLPCLVLEGAVH